MFLTVWLSLWEQQQNLQRCKSENAYQWHPMLTEIFNIDKFHASHDSHFKPAPLYPFPFTPPPQFHPTHKHII